LTRKVPFFIFRNMRETVDSFGEETREILWQAVGRAMSDFQGLEMVLSGLFARLVDGDDNVTLAIYRTSPSLHGRLDLIRNAADGFESMGAHASRVDTDELKNALKLVRTAAENRNLLAHSKVAGVHKWPGGNLGFWLQAERSGHTYYLDAADIGALMATFEPARTAVGALVQGLMNRV
jgi:hypothetical protein